MAKRKLIDGKTKSQHIRDYIAEHPEHRPLQISLALKEKNVLASPTFISVVKWADKKKTKRTKDGGFNIPLLLAAKRFLGKAGNLYSARLILNTVAELTDSK